MCHPTGTAASSYSRVAIRAMGPAEERCTANRCHPLVRQRSAFGGDAIKHVGHLEGARLRGAIAGVPVRIVAASISMRRIIQSRLAISVGCDEDADCSRIEAGC